MKKICTFLLCAALLLPCCGCSTAPEKAQLDLFAMDTLIRLEVYGKNAEAGLSAAQAEILRLEQLFSRHITDSDISRINSAGGAAVPVSPETLELLEQALSIRSRTGGLFDITIAPVADLWGFGSGEYRVPEAGEIASALTHVGTGLELSVLQAALADPQAALDLGGIAKGYTGDLLMQLLRQQEVDSAVLSLGGNVVLLGSRPDGTDWRVAIRDPQDQSLYAGVIEASDCHIVTSGAYERNFQQDGVTYHHILDPRTGAPSDSGLLSVTVVAGSGLLADALSTALFIMGEEAAEAHWRESGDFEMLLITEDGRILATEGIKFEATNGAYSYETIQNHKTD